MTHDAENTATTMEIAELETERLPLSQVEPHPENPRIHPPEQIKAIQESYRLDGYIAGSMAVQMSRKRLYKGHAVYEALSGIGVTHADFVVKELTDAETLALLARDNALSDMSTNDFPKLKEISVKLEKMDVPIERMGQTLESMKSLGSDWAKSEAGNRVIEEGDPPKTSGNTEQSVYEVIVTTKDEASQTKLHKALVKQGKTCRVSTVLRRSGNKQAQRLFPELVKCNMCEATEDLQRHHTDGNTSNNSAENIQALCRSHHVEIHRSAKVV